MILRKIDYSTLVNAISRIHNQAQMGAVSAVNRFLVFRNWIIGAYLIEYEQKGKDRAKYAERLLSKLSADLQKQKVPGCSRQMLQRMRLLYQIYPQIGKYICSPEVSVFDLPKNINLGLKCPPAVSKLKTEKFNSSSPLAAKFLVNLSWTHFVELVSIEDVWKRAFYENECLKGNWSKRQLQRQIASLLYERTGLSTNKKAVIEEGRKQSFESSKEIVDIIRDPYVLEFTGLSEQAHYHESALEESLLNHLQCFLLELGNGFCLESRQKRITVGKENDYIDLVFYHRILRCHLLIDLKIREFKHGDAGQMNFYLNFWRNQMMGKGDNPPIGLILCTEKDETKVEYARGGIDHKLFVSRYMVALPKPEEIRLLIENDRANWEQQQSSRKATKIKEARK